MLPGNLEPFPPYRLQPVYSPGDYAMQIKASELYPENSIVLAPLAGYTDLAFRRAARKCGCRFAFTPLVEAGSVVYGANRPGHALTRGEDEPWLGVQLLAAKPLLLEQAARKIRDYPFDVIDFNMGCPVRKVTRRGAGAALCQTPELAARCIETLVRNSRVPVTAKIRVLDSDCPDKTLDLAKTLLNAGISALTIHGRTWENVYSGDVAVDVIAKVQKNLPIPVIANGGVVDCRSAQRLQMDTGCTRLMVARGAIGNPWIFRSLKSGQDQPPSHQELCATLEEHVFGIVALYGEDSGLRYARKIIAAYLCGRGYRRALRARVTGVSTLTQFQALLKQVKTEGPVNQPDN